MELAELLKSEGLSSELADLAVASGWKSSTFKHAVSKLEELDSVLGEIFPEKVLTALQKATIRSVWSTLQESGASGSAESPTPAATEPREGSWVESFAPKISSSSISEMKRKYLVNYPSEILNYSTQPSTRLLSLASHQQNKKDWRWIPWKFRMTEERASEILMSRPNKQPRLEAIGLSGMLLDEPPALEIQDHSMGVNAIQKLMNVHDVSLAMVGTAHLARLKGYTTKFISLLTQKFDASSGLRPPSVLEAQQADCRLWQGMITLVTDKGWTMDDALYEFTEVRGEMPSLLQARARPPPIPKGWDGKGKTNKGLGKMLVESYAKGTAIPLHSTLLSVRHQKLQTLSDLAKVRITERRIWMRVSSQSSNKRRLSTESVRILGLYESWLLHMSPMISMRPASVFPMEAQADASAQGQRACIGGFVSHPSLGQRWFREEFTYEEFRELQIPVQQDMQLDIACYEALAQGVELVAKKGHRAKPSLSRQLRPNVKGQAAGMSDQAYRDAHVPG
ncbi:unnamed protein product [Symbiodinium sp. CCMP2592]|nr:unnamed protein product [Symbiodinium sp. CCMP2592]